MPFQLQINQIFVYLTAFRKYLQLNMILWINFKIPDLLWYTSKDNFIRVFLSVAVPGNKMLNLSSPGWLPLKSMEQTQSFSLLKVSLSFPQTKSKYRAIGWSSLLRDLKRSMSYNFLFSSQWLEPDHVSGGLMSFMRIITCQFQQNLNKLCCFLIWNGSKRFCD